jgi:hypothetical protein
MNPTRRKVLLSALFGTGMVGLRSLASGLPINLLMNPRKAYADTACAAAPQYLILSTSAGGEPINANAPGMYVDGIYHPADRRMVETPLSIGGKTYTAAKPWADLGQDILSRTCFFHHATYTNSHGDLGKVNELMGATRRSEHFFSIFAKYLQPCLQTIQTAPVAIANNFVKFNGAVQPVVLPGGLKSVLNDPTGLQLDLQKLRDSDLDRLNALYRRDGTAAQKKVLDQYALSQKQARDISQQLLGDLDLITGATLPSGVGDPIDMNIAAAILIKMQVSPVVVMNYTFGGDNHGDPGLAQETTDTLRSTDAIKDLVARLRAYQIEDKTTIALHNVFGRTLATSSHRNNADGRNHHDKHCTGVLIGKPFKSCVIGGVESMGAGKDFRAQAIDSTSGQPNASGDIPYESLLASFGKTLGAAVGMPAADLENEITSGKVVSAALA